MASTNGTATTTLTVSMAELLKGKLLDRSSLPSGPPATPEGNRQEAIRPPGETQDTATEIASNMQTNKATHGSKKTNKKTTKGSASQKPEAQAKPETVPVPAGTGATRAVVANFLGQILAATKQTVAAAGGTKAEQEKVVAKTMKTAERKVLTLDTVERNGEKQLLLVSEFSNGLIKLCKDADIEREFVKGEGTYFKATDRKAVLKILRSVWNYGGSILVCDGASPEVLPRHDEEVSAFKAQAAK